MIGKLKVVVIHLRVRNECIEDTTRAGVAPPCWRLTAGQKRLLGNADIANAARLR
jgi:hypothetical protein